MSIKVIFVLQCGLVNELPDNVLFRLMRSGVMSPSKMNGQIDG